MTPASLLARGSALLVAVCLPQVASAQGHAHHAPSAPDTTETAAHASHASHDAHGVHSGHVAHAGGSSIVPGAPMTADGSGTSWLPTAGPMEMAHSEAGRWRLGLHGAVYPRVTAQDVFGAGDRGGTQFSAPNWIMGMAQRSFSDGTQLSFRGMFTLDPITESRNGGYPLLFQTGETYRGRRLVDRQHPHDLVAELSALLAARLSPDVTAFAYAAYPGEPALGPTAFMHRPSARFSPDAPLSHHWQDATHVVWGVATGGVAVGPVKLDASVFTGPEPDEDRYTPDPPLFDSYSGRISVSPSGHWALQVSRAFLREPDVLEPNVNKVRTTASVLYAGALGAHGDLTATLAWGRNEHKHNGIPGSQAQHFHGPQNAFLAETALRTGPWAVFGRGEVVEKSGAEMGFAGPLQQSLHTVGALSLGGARRVARVGGLETMLGLQATTYAVPDDLRPYYGDAPVSGQVFLRISPTAMAHGGMEM